jgi:hypothetical protein
MKRTISIVLREGTALKKLLCMQSLVAYYQKYVDEQSKQEIKDILVQFDRSLLVADPRRFDHLINLASSALNKSSFTILYL